MLTWTSNRGRVNLLYWISVETNTIGHPQDSSHWLPIRRAEQKQPLISERSNLTLHLNWRSHGCSLAKTEKQLYNRTAEINCWKKGGVYVFESVIVCVSVFYWPFCTLPELKKNKNKLQSLCNGRHFAVWSDVGIWITTTLKLTFWRVAWTSIRLIGLKKNLYNYVYNINFI